MSLVQAELGLSPGGLILRGIDDIQAGLRSIHIPDGEFVRTWTYETAYAASGGSELVANAFDIGMALVGPGFATSALSKSGQLARAVANSNRAGRYVWNTGAAASQRFYRAAASLNSKVYGRVLDSVRQPTAGAFFGISGKSTRNPISTLDQRLAKIAARSPAEIANRARIADLIRKARKGGDPGVDKLVRNLELNGIRVSDVNVKVGTASHPITDYDVVLPYAILQVKKTGGATRLINQIQTTEKTTNLPIIGVVLSQTKAGRRVAKYTNAKVNTGAVNDFYELLDFLKFLKAEY